MFFKYSRPLSNFSYLVCIPCKIFIRWRFYLFLKTENSRRVAESRPVYVGLYTFENLTLQNFSFFVFFETYYWSIGKFYHSEIYKLILKL
jgi:hypothetical protein